MNNKKIESNSYYLDYKDENFIVGLAYKDKSEKVNIKGYMECDKEGFKEFFRGVLKQVEKYNQINKANFLEELLEESEVL